MTELDLSTKFNRGLCLSLIDTNVVEAIRMYREYTSYLYANDKAESYKKELIAVRVAFLNKLSEFINDNKNKDKTYELIAAYQELITAFPNEPLFYKNAADCFDTIEQFDISAELLLKAEEINSDDIEIKKALFHAYINLKDFEKAKEYAEVVAEKEPDDSDNYYRMGQVYDKLYDLTENEEYIKKAILNLEIAKKINPDKKIYHKGLTILYTKTNNFEKVKETWKDCFRFRNELTNIDYIDYAMFLIREGDFKNGFEYYEARFKSETRPVKYPSIKKPVYNGKQDISKKTLLVQAEQGHGDVFLFSRFFNDLKNKTAKIIARVPKTTEKIIRQSFPFVEVVSTKEDLNEAKFDCHIPLMSIPKAVGLTKDTIPYTDKYLVSDENLVREFKNKYFNNSKFKIGIVFEGSKRGLYTRNIKLDYLLPLALIDNVQVYSLQYKEPDETFKDTKIINTAPFIKTFDETAAIIENMDLIVTVDNSVMNLAGGLGKKTFCLFNLIPEFRWFDLSGDDVKWYKTVKPYQCKKQSEWEPVIERVVADIKGML